MIGGNASKRPPNGAETTCALPSYHCFDTSMPQYAITLASDLGNSELP